MREERGMHLQQWLLASFVTVSVTIFRTICHSKMSTKRACGFVVFVSSLKDIVDFNNLK